MGARILTGLALLLWIAGAAPPARPQQADATASGTEAEAGAEGPADAEAEAEPETPEPELPLDLGASEASRASRISRAIESDRVKLADLRQEVMVGGRDLKQRQAREKKLAQERGELAAALEQLGPEADPEERKALETKLDTVTQAHDLAEKTAGIVFQALKTHRKQIRALEEKIELDTRDLNLITGLVAPAVPGESAAGEAIPPSAPSPGGLPSLLMHPALSGGTPAPPTPAKSQLPETAQQIEARMEAEKRERDARRAEQAVASFVDRKAALEEQIELERQVLRTAQDAEQTLEEGLAALQVTLTGLIADGASQSELQRVQKGIVTTTGDLDLTRSYIDERTAEIDALQKRMVAAQQDQLAVSAEAGRKRQQAVDARQRSIWLDSPFHPENVVRWALDRGPRIFLVALAAASMLLMVRFFATRITKMLVRGSRRRRGGVNRADTLAVSFRSVGSAVILITGSLLMLEEAGVSVTTVLGGAAIFGVAIAFGAQNLMRDYFNGLVILIEDQYELNDLLTIGTITGRVERLNLRTTVLRDLGGRVHFIPNGEIKAVTNHTYEWARAVFDIGIAYREDVDLVMRTLLELADELRADPEWKEMITEEPTMLGVDRFAESGPVIKFMMKTAADSMFPVRREMLRRIKMRFDQLGIEIPVPHRVVFQRQAEISPAELSEGVEEP